TTTASASRRRSTASGIAPTPSTRKRGNYQEVTISFPVRSESEMPLDQADLVAAAKGGDEAAFEELVRSTYADAYTLALRLTGNEEDARDVVQDAYLRAYKGIRRFRGDAQFSTWMYRIVANCANTALGR